MRSRAKALHTFFVLGLIAGLCSCMADTRFVTFVPIGQKGWVCSDTLRCMIPPLRGVGGCRVSLLFHTEGYGYENFAVDVDICQDSVQLYRKQHHYLLGEIPSAKGIGRRCDYTLPVSNLVLCDTLPTTVTLVHQMELPALMGIREVGVCIGEPMHESAEEVWRVVW